MKHDSLLSLCVLLFLTACRVDATVEARVDGRSGEVRARFELDAEAVAVLGGQVAEGAQVADLRRAGWTIPAPRRTGGGGVVVEASKRFGRPEDLGRVMAELSGASGPLREFRLERDRSLGGVRYRLRGVIDLGGGAAATGFANARDLPERLREAGIDPKRVAELLTSRAAEGFALRVVVDLPGEERANTTTRRGEEPAWETPLGERVEVTASSSVSDRLRPALLAVAAVLALAALGVAAIGRRH